jgi:hypothetical protein
MPVRLVNLPQGIYLYPESDILIPVLVRGTGFHILLYHLGENYIEYPGYDVSIGENILDWEKLYQSMPMHKNLFISSIPTEDPVIFSTDRIIQRIVPVVFDFESESDMDAITELNFVIDDFTVTVSGPELLVREITNVSTEIVSADILRSHTKIVKLNSPNEHIILFPQTIELTTVPEIMTTKTLTFIPIYHNSDLYSIFPERVTVKIEGKQDILQQTTVEDIRAYIDAIEYQNNTRAKIHIIVPKYITIIDKTPSEVIVNVKN